MVCGRDDPAEPESSSAAVDNDPREGAGLAKMQSFVQMKQASKDRAAKGMRIKFKSDATVLPVDRAKPRKRQEKP